MLIFLFFLSYSPEAMAFEHCHLELYIPLCPLLVTLWCPKWYLSGNLARPGCISPLALLSSPLQLSAIRFCTQRRLGVWDTPETWCWPFNLEVIWSLGVSCSLFLLKVWVSMDFICSCSLLWNPRAKWRPLCFHLAKGEKGKGVEWRRGGQQEPNRQRV